MITALFSVMFLLIGLVGGWFVADKYDAYLEATRVPTVPHDFEDLFQLNPHPEIYDSEGKIDRGEYIAIDFPFGFDPADISSGDYYFGEMDEE